MVRIGNTELDVYPLQLGGNVFGWTADEAASFEVLDAYAEAGGNFVDLADTYGGPQRSEGGDWSEAVVGRWLDSRDSRERMVIATKVGMGVDSAGLEPKRIREHAEESLRRLGTDYIDLYYAHRDDEQTPMHDVLSAFDALVREGKVRYIAASNFSAPRLTEALRISAQDGLASYVALQPHYNLLERAYETELARVVAANGMSALPYFGLGAGFLTGKYEPGTEISGARAGRVSAYAKDPRAPEVLRALRTIAAHRGAEPATVALAWLRVQPTVAAPIASARSAEQLPALLASAELELSTEELASLAAATDS